MNSDINNAAYGDFIEWARENKRRADRLETAALAVLLDHDWEWSVPALSHITELREAALDYRRLGQTYGGESMKVYLVVQSFDDNTHDVIAIYASQVDAEKRAETEKGIPCWDPEVLVIEHEVIPEVQA